MKRYIVVIASLFFCQVVFGQDPLLSVSKIDSLPDIIQYYLRETTSKHFEDPKVPRFLLKDKTDNFVFGVGGGVEARMFYDNCGNKSTSINYSRNVGSVHGNDVIDLNLNTTNLVFKVLGKTKTGVIDALVSVNFNNANGGISLLEAYVDLLGLRIGKTNTGFRDDQSINLVDINSVLVGTARKVPQVSYSYRFKNGLRVQAGVEFTQSASIWEKYEDGTSSITPYTILLPDMTANLFYTGERLHLYGGANCRIMNYYNTSGMYQGYPSYAFQVGGNWAFIKNSAQTHKLFAQGIWSHGMADCCNSMRKQGLSFVYIKETSQVFVPNIYGGSVGYQAVFGNNTIDVAASVSSVTGHENAGIGEMYKWAYSGVVNYFRKFFTYATVGVEGVVGQRYDVDNKASLNGRAYLFLRYNF